ncbi:MAG: winged helix-turn-helix domain-containing protein [Agrobacterium sp.]|nr:winged helix-turn-helix domain-containing protein [Agrobacterium sp.]
MTITSTDKILLNNILVDFTNQLIFRNEKSEPIDAQGLKVLASLLAHYPETVTREQLLNDAWKGLVVSDNSLSQCITLLRKSLGDDPKSTIFIRTVPRKGYQLIAEISAPIQQARVPKTVYLAYQKKLAGLALGVFTVAVLVVGIWLWLFEQNNRSTINDMAE